MPTATPPAPTAATRTARALSHPLRPQILATVRDSGVLSPNGFATLSGAPLGNVSYHFRHLAADGHLTLSRTEPRRGAVEHFYKLSSTGQAVLEVIDQL